MRTQLFQFENVFLQIYLNVKIITFHIKKQKVYSSFYLVHVKERFYNKNKYYNLVLCIKLSKASYPETLGLYDLQPIT